ncbi:MAG: DUF6448 family protein [Desulfobacterales bacterium]
MKNSKQPKTIIAHVLSGFMIVLIFGNIGFSHCDSLDGPVIQDARLAFANNDVVPVLKWVDKEDEGEIREAFAKTVALRTKGDEIREIAENYFFETLVRIHRQSEGEGFTGLKPAGIVDPGIDAADQALEAANGTNLAKKISNAVYQGILERFAKTMEKKKRPTKALKTVVNMSKLMCNTSIS